MSDCTQKAANLKGCNCTYDCSTKGNCCACVSYHRGMHQFPACFFSARQNWRQIRSVLSSSPRSVAGTGENHRSWPVICALVLLPRWRS